MARKIVRLCGARRQEPGHASKTVCGRPATRKRVTTRFYCEHCAPEGAVEVKRHIVAQRVKTQDCGWGAEHEAHPHPGMPNTRCPGNIVVRAHTRVHRDGKKTEVKRHGR